MSPSIQRLVLFLSATAFLLPLAAHEGANYQRRKYEADYRLYVLPAITRAGVVARMEMETEAVKRGYARWEGGDRFFVWEGDTTSSLAAHTMLKKCKPEVSVNR